MIDRVVKSLFLDDVNANGHWTTVVHVRCQRPNLSNVECIHVVSHLHLNLCLFHFYFFLLSEP
jgi:hypothetical protein